MVRTAWLYGAGGPNFVRTMIRLAGERETLDVVDDQRGQPTWSADLGRTAARPGPRSPGRRRRGQALHGTSAGKTTWFGLTREIFRLLGTDPDRVHHHQRGIHPQAPTGLQRPRPRPLPRPVSSG
ncbi:dTDP-4-dehydrorhamnose reductase [Streptomyces alboniger]